MTVPRLPPPPLPTRPSPVLSASLAVLAALLLQGLPASGRAQGLLNAPAPAATPPPAAASAERAGPDVPLLELPPDGTLPPEAAAALAASLERLRIATTPDGPEEERELRRADRAAREALATEGYFAPRLSFEPRGGSGPRFTLQVEPGPRTTVGALTLEFRGAIDEPRFAQRLAELRAAWSLPVGAPMRSAEWERAKQAVLTALQARDFAGARIAASHAEVDAREARARLTVEIDSGPAYTIGRLQVEGLQRFSPGLLERYDPPPPGTPYDRAQVLAFQQRLQDAPYFATVLVAPQLDAEHPERVPLRVDVTEARARRLATGIGYSTDTGVHLEANYEQLLVFDRPYTLQAGARIDQRGGFAFTDLRFPPGPNGWRDAVGVLYDNDETEGLRVHRWAIGATRTRLNGLREGRNTEITFAVNFEREDRDTPLGEPIVNNALSGTTTWVKRAVDSVTDPRRGYVWLVEGTVGASGASFSRGFVRGYTRIAQYVPVGARDVLIVRGELGAVLADSADFVPSKFLFRTGGATTVRGYAFQSLGVEQDGAIVGGRMLGVGSVEYVHWLEQYGGNWGMAGFVDAGNASETARAWSAAWSVGVGARYRTLAGPLAVDVAWAERDRRVRVQFAVAIAF